MTTQSCLLLVEDDADNRELMRELLEDMGYLVRSAGSAGEALSLAAAFPVDLVITDVGLPDLGGLELARRLQDIRRGLPIVVVTGFDLSRQGNLPEVTVMMKPVDPRELEGLLSRLLAGAQAPVEEAGL